MKLTERFLKSSVAILFLMSVFICEVKSQDVEQFRPVVGLYSLKMGQTSVKASYLTPLTYVGNQFGVYGNWTKAMPFNPEEAIMTFDFNADFCNLLNPARTARMIGINGDFSWDMSWRKHLPNNFQVSAGGGVDLLAGAYYLFRNSNNPAQIQANLSLMLAAGGSWHFRIGKLPVLIADRVKLPSLGVFFCPGYGETYYEIYLGNHKGLAHAGWWGNNFRIDNLLSFTLDFGKTALTLGYNLNVYTQWANYLNTKIITNSFVIGVVPGGIGLKNNKKKLQGDVVYSLY